MTAALRTIKTRFVELSWDAIGFVRAIVLPQAQLTVDDAIAIGDARMQLSAGKRCPLFMDIRNVKSATKDCRNFGSTDDLSRQPTAMALLVGSPISRVIGNFYIGLNRPLYPIQLFTSEAQAIDWLKAYI